MALPQLPQLVSVSFLDNRNFGNAIAEIPKFLSPTFSLSLSYFCWNFGNGVAEIQQKYEREREKVGERKF